MMDSLVWMVIIGLFILSYIGLVYPVLPSSLFIWIGFLLYHFLISSMSFGWFFWCAMAGLTLVLLLADIASNRIFVKKYGGSEQGERGAAIAVIIGSFIIPPFGIIIVPFITVLLIEWLRQVPFQQAYQAALGSLFGFFSSMAVKVVLQAMMIIWFFVVIII